MIFLGSDKWISLRTSGFVNPLVRRTSRFFDEIRALRYGILKSIRFRDNVYTKLKLTNPVLREYDILYTNLQTYNTNKEEHS